MRLALRRLSSPDRRLLLGAILLVGVALRIETLGAHLSNDEGYSYLVGSAPSLGSFLHRLAAYENTPPLFYLLLRALPLGHAAWLRVPAALPGALIPLVLYLALRRALGVRAALLAAAITAVAPYHVSYSDYARGFMLEGLGCMLALWAMLRLIDGATGKWWLLYVAGAVLALYSEYFAAIFLLALTFAGVAYTPGGRLRTGALGLLPLASLLPWLGQIERGQDALHHTKMFASFPSPSLGTLRELSVRLVLGEHGAGSSTALRWLELLGLVIVLTAVVAVLGRRIAGEQSSPASRTVLVIATTGALVLVGHALVALLGHEILNQRYLTVLIPIGAALVAAAIGRSPVRWGWTGALTALALLAVAVFAQRYQREYEPDLAPVRVAVTAQHPRTVLTNSAVVIYYLRGLHPVLDRPFGLGPGLERSCAAPCLVIDDSRVPGGVRPGPGPSRAVGFFGIRTASDARPSP
ncbi:MAG: glycosyltransferase family 39 protein [Solirubrobacteraceae bacterium]